MQKIFLIPEARVQEFSYYSDNSYIIGTFAMLQLFNSKSDGHGYTVGQALLTVSSFSRIALMVNVRKGATISSHSTNNLEFI